MSSTSNTTTNNNGTLHYQPPEQPWTTAGTQGAIIAGVVVGTMILACVGWVVYQVYRDHRIPEGHVAPDYNRRPGREFGRRTQEEVGEGIEMR